MLTDEQIADLLEIYGDGDIAVTDGPNLRAVIAALTELQERRRAQERPQYSGRTGPLTDDEIEGLAEACQRWVNLPSYCCNLAAQTLRALNEIRERRRTEAVDGARA